MICWNNEIKNDDTAVFSINDRIRLGDGVFDTLLIIDGAALYLEEHLSRLQRHLSILGIQANITVNHVTDFIGSTTGHQVLNIVATRGEAERGLKTPQQTEPTIVMKLSPVPDEFPPLNAIIAKSTRRNEHSPLSQIKSLNYGDNIIAMREAEARNANEAIMLNTQDYTTCFCTGNLFAKIDGEYITPPLSDGVMDGVIRGFVIKHLNATKRSLTAEDLDRAESLYMTNSIRGIVPVMTLDGHTLNSPDLQLNKTILTP